MKDSGSIIEKIHNKKERTGSSRIRKGEFSKPSGSLEDRVLYLQRNIGNLAVNRLIKSGALQAKIASDMDTGVDPGFDGHTLHQDEGLIRRQKDKEPETKVIEGVSGSPAPAPGVFPPSLPPPVPGMSPVPRLLPFVVMKRNNIKFSPTVGTDYGHWWTEIDGTESYGWWPDHCPVTITETLLGTGGDLNGVKGCGGTPTTDPHHGDSPDSMFNPTLTVPKTDAMVRSDIRGFAARYSGEWRWTFGYGQNCRSFQKSLMAAVGLKEP